MSLSPVDHEGGDLLARFYRARSGLLEATVTGGSNTKRTSRGTVVEAGNATMERSKRVETPPHSNDDFDILEMRERVDRVMREEGGLNKAQEGTKTPLTAEKRRSMQALDQDLVEVMHGGGSGSDVKDSASHFDLLHDSLREGSKFIDTCTTTTDSTREGETSNMGGDSSSWVDLGAPSFSDSSVERVASRARKKVLAQAGPQKTRAGALRATSRSTLSNSQVRNSGSQIRAASKSSTRSVSIVARRPTSTT